MSNAQFLAVDEVELQLKRLQPFVNGGAGISFELHSDDNSDELFTALRHRLNRRFKVSMVEIPDDEQTPVPQRVEEGVTSVSTTPAPTEGIPSARVMSLANKAGAACSAADFQGYLFDRFLPKPHPVNPVERRKAADEIVKLHCGIKSKTELIPGSEAAQKYLALRHDFQNEFRV